VAADDPGLRSPRGQGSPPASTSKIGRPLRCCKQHGESCDLGFCKQVLRPPIRRSKVYHGNVKEANTSLPKLAPSNKASKAQSATSNHLQLLCSQAHHLHQPLAFMVDRKDGYSPQAYPDPPRFIRRNPRW